MIFSQIFALKERWMSVCKVASSCLHSFHLQRTWQRDSWWLDQDLRLKDNIAYWCFSHISWMHQVYLCSWICLICLWLTMTWDQCASSICILILVHDQLRAWSQWMSSSKSWELRQSKVLWWFNFADRHLFLQLLLRTQWKVQHSWSWLASSFLWYVWLFQLLHFELTCVRQCIEKQCQLMSISYSK